MSDTDYVTENDDIHDQHNDVNSFFRDYMMSQIQIEALNFGESQKPRDYIKQKQKEIQEQMEKNLQKLKVKMKTSKFKRTKDKWGFVFGVMSLIISSFLLGYDPYMYFNFYIFKIIALVLIRTIRYKAKKMILYLLDFCYYANLIFLVYLSQMYNPAYKDVLFRIGFMFANGPIILAIPIYRNSLVFHSLDRITSVILHISGPLVFYQIRWYDHLNRFNIDPSIEILPYMLNGILTYLVWLAFYYFYVFIWLSEKERTHTESSFQYFRKVKALNVLGPKYVGLVYCCIHFLVSIGLMIITIFMYISQTVHCAVIFLCICSFIWNGANFYMEYFSRKYEQNLKQIDEITKSIQEKDKND